MEIPSTLITEIENLLNSKGITYEKHLGNKVVNYFKCEKKQDTGAIAKFNIFFGKPEGREICLFLPIEKLDEVQIKDLEVSLDKFLLGISIPYNTGGQVSSPIEVNYPDDKQSYNIWNEYVLEMMSRIYENNK